jgi:hypothetical protein
MENKLINADNIKDNFPWSAKMHRNGPSLVRPKMSPTMTRLWLDMARVGVQAVTHLVLGPVVDMVQGEEQTEVARVVVVMLAVQTTLKAMLCR